MCGEDHVHVEDHGGRVVVEMVVGMTTAVDQGSNFSKHNEEVAVDGGSRRRLWKPRRPG